MTTNIVLTGVGRDKVGIVAELSQILFEFGCNLLDSSMTLLRGEFAVILMAQLPESQTLDDLRRRLAQSEERHGMNVFLRELSPEELDEPEEEGLSYIISVYGADRAGIVSGITRALADLGVNLTDVQTKRTTAEKSLFLMVLEVSLPSNISEEQLRTTLSTTSEKLAVETSIQSMEVVEF